MGYDEKLIRYIASKMIQRKHLALKGEFPSETKLAQYVNRVLETLKENHKQLRLVRTQSQDGFLTPLVKGAVDKLVF